MSIKIRVLVGKDEVAIKVEQALLEQHSDKFRRALSHEFQESITRTVKLPDYEPEAFRHCKRWMRGAKFEPVPNCT